MIQPPRRQERQGGIERVKVSKQQQEGPSHEVYLSLLFEPFLALLASWRLMHAYET